MEYQNQKIRAIGRLTMMAAALTFVLSFCLMCPDKFQIFLENVPLSRFQDEYLWLSVLIIMAPICWAIDLLLIFTSPEQEVRIVNWSKRWLKTTSDFEKISFDKNDPDYKKVAWRYFLERRKRDLA